MPRILTLVLALLLTACAPSGEDDGVIKVGAIFDFTGPTADVGVTYAEGIRSYLAWLKEQGGIETGRSDADGQPIRRPVELIFQDYGYKTDLAEKHYDQFVQEGMVAFFGWGVDDTEALRARTTDNRIPFLSASYAHVLGNPQEAPFHFLVGTSYSDQFVILLDWILESHTGDAPPAVALMHHPSPLALSLYEQGGRDYAASKGIRLTVHEMPWGGKDYTAQLTDVHDSGAQYVIFQNTPEPVAAALGNARDLGLDLRFLCLNWCANELLTELAKEDAEGVAGAVTFSPLGAGVTGLADAIAFLETRGGAIEEKTLVYGQGWITAAVMIEGIRRAVAGGGRLTGEKVKLALETLRDFDTGGVTPPITFTADDHRGARGLRLFEVRGGVWQPLTDLLTAPDWEG